ncbi:SDR family NAD(P)-dependent oxidoreductase [Virgibacillus sp. W0181]|uniref:SDR family NAD(P)-dependent oxidoreductase n=1 Tax=Virgibacillus sp. W0181 TaxID=3391581 RepID=UPI003F4721ED
MKRLSGKVAIITGAASGQGAAEARLFAKEGAKVIATDLQVELLKTVVTDINNEYGEVAIALRHDVTVVTDWENTVSKAITNFGKIDILVNNAGIGGEEGFASFDDVDLESFNKFLKVNTTSNFIGIKHVAPEMKKVGSGSIINISSVAGIIGGGAGVHYTTSKGANRLLAKGAAMELAQFNIRVNSVHPGYIDTPMVSVVTEDEESITEIKKGIPLGYLGTAEDVAQTVLFLASDESRYITGTKIIIDGGMIAK